MDVEETHCLSKVATPKAISSSKKFLRKHQHVLVCLCIVISTLSVYWQVHNNDFVNFDDDLYVYENRHIQFGFTLDSVIWAFTTNHASNWHPLTWLSHMLDYQLYGMNPRGHHLTNLFFHIVDSLLLFFVFRKMTGHLWQSAFVALLFALHPLHVESVAWISERKDVLSTFFWMLTMWSYAWYAEHPKVGRYLLVLLFFILGLMAKPMLVTLPFVLLLVDFYPLNRIQFHLSPTRENSRRKSAVFRLVLEKIPLFVFVIISSAITFYAQKHGGAVASLDAIPIKVRIANSLVSYVSYIIKMVWPSDLAVLYPVQTMIPGWKIVGAGVFLLSISIIVIISMKQRPYLSVGWFWYMGTLVPVIGLVQVGSQSMADRYTYIPLIGLFTIIAWGTSEFGKRWRLTNIIFPTIAILILFSFMSVTYLQVQNWKNNITLFGHTLEVTSNNWLSHINIGNALHEQGRIDNALKHYIEALRIKNDLEEAHYNLGLVLNEQGRIDEAIKHYVEALRIKPDYENAHNNLGIILIKQGRVGEAIKHYVEALRINPDHENAHNNLGNALLGQGRINEAIKHYIDALRINPNFESAHNNIGEALTEQGRIDEAIKHYVEALRIKPDYENAHNNLGNALLGQGRINEAIKHYIDALRINPNFESAHNNIGEALTKQGRIDEAIKHYVEALRLKPDHEEAHNNLGAALYRKGNIEGAIEHIRKAIKINPDYVRAKNNLKKILKKHPQINN